MPCTPSWPGHTPGAASGSAPTIHRYCSVLQRGFCYVPHPGQASRQGQPQAPLQQSSGSVVYCREVFAMYPILSWPGLTPGAASGSAPTIHRYCSVLQRGLCHVPHPFLASHQGQPQAPLQKSTGTVVYSREGLVINPILARPHTRGSLRLRSNNPQVL